MTNGVIHLLNEVIYTGDEVREEALISAAPALLTSIPTLSALTLLLSLHTLLL